MSADRDQIALVANFDPSHTKAVLGCERGGLETVVRLTGRPRVRIRLPPPVSHVSRGRFTIRGEKATAHRHLKWSAVDQIHHAAFDAHLIGIDPDFRIHAQIGCSKSMMVRFSKSG
jgi:hypothetical protein